MLIKTEKSQAIIDFLNTDLLINQNIIGILENVPKAHIYVDDINNPKGVFVEKGYMHYIYTKEDSFIEEVCDTFFKEGFYGFSGVEKSIAEKIKSKFELHWENPCTLLYLPKDKLDLSLIKSPVGSIVIDDAETVDKYYEYRDDGSIERIKDDIRNRPSSAVYIDGKIASWVLIHDDNSMGIMYTKEEHRKKGYAIDVSIDLASKIIDQGKIPYIQIVEGNYKSIGLSERCGFERCGDVVWFGIIAGIPKEIKDENDKSREQFIKSFNNDEKIEYFINDSNYHAVYQHLINFKENSCINNKLKDFELKQVIDTQMAETWCDIVCKGYEIPKEHEESTKKMLLEMTQRKDSKYKLFIGMLNREPVSSSAMLEFHEWASGVYFLTTLPYLRNQGIVINTLTETLDAATKHDIGLIFTQATDENVCLFKECGFKESHKRGKSE